MIRRTIRRTAMRALLVDPELREILLIKALVPDTGDELWFTPGGGKEGNESDADCLAREVLEETGLQTLPQARLVWTRREKFVFMGEDYDQDERYFLLLTPRFEIAQQALEVHEQETFVASRWWGLDEICASDELFVPADLGALVRKLLNDLLSGTLKDTVQHVGR